MAVRTSRLDGVRVTPIGDGWQVKRDAEKTSATYASKGEAVRAARAAISHGGGILHVHEKGGRIRESITLGRSAAAKMGAVEGIDLGGRVKRDLEAFDQQDLGGEERRMRIRETYGRKSPR
jgi:hypothetical protein